MSEPGSSTEALQWLGFARNDLIGAKESAREKSIRNGHPSTLHLWWARSPLDTSFVDRIVGGGLPEEWA